MTNYLLIKNIDYDAPSSTSYDEDDDDDDEN